MSPATPVRCLPVVPPEDMGLPQTPPQCVLIMPSDELLEEGYDSDMQHGPFLQHGVMEESFEIMDEVEKTATEDETAEPDEVVESAPPPLTSNAIKKMKVKELRTALEVRGLSKNGLKAVLVARLEDAVKNNVPLMQNCAPEIINNSAGDAYISEPACVHTSSKHGEEKEENFA